MEGLNKLVRVSLVKPLAEFVVHMEFEDGTSKRVDLSPLMKGAIFDELRHDVTLFRGVTIAHGTLAWANGADIDPDVLSYDLAPALFEAIEPIP